MLICNRSSHCNDSSCYHRKPHKDNWWCERKQMCSTRVRNSQIEVFCYEYEQRKPSNKVE